MFLIIWLTKQPDRNMTYADRPALRASWRIRPF
jgi:hypothetical protein